MKPVAQKAAINSEPDRELGVGRHNCSSIESEDCIGTDASGFVNEDNGVERILISCSPGLARWWLLAESRREPSKLGKCEDVAAAWKSGPGLGEVVHHAEGDEKPGK
jgi:hypothetical protein